jgi:hypothetical protein
VKEQMTRGQVLQHHLFARNGELRNIPENQGPEGFLGFPIGGQRNENAYTQKKTEKNRADSQRNRILSQNKSKYLNIL